MIKKKEQFEILRSQLSTERATFLPTWREAADFILPRRPRFLVSDTNRGDRRSTKIIDSTATQAVSTLQSGMMAGLSSPARPWFRLTTPDQGMADYGPVKEWLYKVSSIMETSMARGNLYNVLPMTYSDIGVFATGAFGVEEDFADVSRFTSFPIGSYMIGNDERGRVNTFFREFRMTVRQLIQKFGVKDATGKPDWSKFSTEVRNHWERGNKETWINVCHVIQPNPDFDETKIDAKFKKFTSCYYERGGEKDGTYNGSDNFLRESGYDYFPVLAPRWQTTGEDSYGTTCPGLVCLGDIKQLQIGERRIMQAIEKMVNPPMVGPPEMKTLKASILPGDITYIRELDGQKGFRPAHLVEPRVNELEMKQAQVRNRIEKAFYVDMFQMFANSDRREMTAAEVAERHEEKLFALGPMLEQQNQDLFNPLIDLQFDFLLRQGQIPPPPQEIQGVKLKVEFVSIMAQAQKLAGVSNIERFTSFVGNLVTTTQDPTIVDKVDFDQLIDIYGDLTSVPPGIIRTDEAVAQIKQNRAQAQQEAQQQQAEAQQAQNAKNLAGASLEGDNALKRVIEPKVA